MKYLTLFVWMVVMLSVRVLVKHCASQNLVKSSAYSSMDNWDSEGVFLREAGLNVYDNDIVHQPPLALHLWSVALRYTENWVAVYFLLFELIIMCSILKLCDVCINVLIWSDQRTQPNVHTSSRSLILSRDDFVLCRYLMIICYCFNPYSILAFASQSTSVIWNITSVWTLITCFQNRLFISSCFCALGCYLRLYSGLLLLPILAVANIVSRFLEIKTTDKYYEHGVCNLFIRLWHRCLILFFLNCLLSLDNLGIMNMLDFSISSCLTQVDVTGLQIVFSQAQ
ncbi:hypothetical protein PHET_11676 [Paragonimus heterotremus]|uniref:GPI mannosyltransferase 2 n=1 Tax=Paragonimus heterotremus TaxID=100268 RepID=A0A8J4SYQ3_9TREM|nr:hypothetical protein PHET_11676 [Paragonimus heterotremus]